jgi:hypothetical protein
MSLDFSSYHSFFDPKDPLMELPLALFLRVMRDSDMLDRALWNTIFHSYPRRALELQSLRREALKMIDPWLLRATALVLDC